eukprot:1327866-Heterocapsa_arctica.AAC.1
MITDAPPLLTKVQRKKDYKARWSPMVVNYSRNPTTTTTPKKTSSWANYNLFSLLEDAEDESEDK